MAGINTFSHVEKLFAEHGVTKIYVKHLAASQDNEKNQINFGTGGAKVLNLFPGQSIQGNVSQSEAKGNSVAGRQITYLILDFYWLDERSDSFKAPTAKIINYFQYSKNGGESRFSGFINGCGKAPTALRREFQKEFGKRILVLGANAAGKTYGLVLTEKEDPVVSIFPILPNDATVRLFKTHILNTSVDDTPEALIMDDLQNLSGQWHPSVTLRRQSEGPIPFKGTQGAGYTLEALMGIERNSSKKPDKYGFEIKSFNKKGKISLMTPTADMGQQGKLPLREFIEEYGWPSKTDPKSLVFGGRTYKTNNPKEGLELLVNAPATTDKSIPSIGLYRSEDGLLVAGWSFQKLLNSWTIKHSLAAYVEYEKRRYAGSSNLHDFEYRFRRRVMLCFGTDIYRYIDAVKNGIVYYEPGDKLYGDGRPPKCRPQWRLSVSSKFAGKLGTLYESVNEKTLSRA